MNDKVVVSPFAPESRDHARRVLELLQRADRPAAPRRPATGWPASRPGESRPRRER